MAFMHMLPCRLDESADGKREEVFCVSGLFGYPANWFELERLWEKRLGADGLDYFRAVDCENVRGPFEKFRADHKSLQSEERQRAEKVRTDLIDLIVKYKMVAA